MGFFLGGGRVQGFPFFKKIYLSAVPIEAKRGRLGLELQADMSYPVGAGNWTRACKCSKGSVMALASATPKPPRHRLLSWVWLQQLNSCGRVTSPVPTNDPASLPHHPLALLARDPQLSRDDSGQRPVLLELFVCGRECAVCCRVIPTPPPRSRLVSLTW